MRIVGCLLLAGQVSILGWLAIRNGEQLGWLLITSDKITHAIAGFILSLTLYWTIRAHAFAPAPRAVLTLVMMLIFAISSEIIQHLLSNGTRKFDFFDATSDWIGSLVAISIILPIHFMIHQLNARRLLYLHQRIIDYENEAIIPDVRETFLSSLTAFRDIRKWDFLLWLVVAPYYSDDQSVIYSTSLVTNTNQHEPTLRTMDLRTLMLREGYVCNRSTDLNSIKSRIRRLVLTAAESARINVDITSEQLNVTTTQYSNAPWHRFLIAISTISDSNHQIHQNQQQRSDNTILKAVAYYVLLSPKDAFQASYFMVEDDTINSQEVDKLGCLALTRLRTMIVSKDLNYHPCREAMMGCFNSVRFYGIVFPMIWKVFPCSNCIDSIVRACGNIILKWTITFCLFIGRMINRLGKTRFREDTRYESLNDENLTIVETNQENQHIERDIISDILNNQPCFWEAPNVDGDTIVEVMQQTESIV